MTATRPEVSPQGLYTQAETARRLGVDRHTLSRWEKSFRLVPYDCDGHFKRYRGSDIVNAWRGKK